MSRKIKGELRGEMRRVLSNLDRRWIQAASRELCRNLCELLDSKMSNEIEHVLAWVNFFPGEVDLSAFINEQLDRRKIYLPQLRGDTMSFVSIGKDWIGAMEEGVAGIPEPRSTSGEIFSVADVSRSLIIVPGLAFDDSGGRLGRGKGYYDKFLGRSRILEIAKVGVCWSLQMLSEVPTESHDAFMDWVVTEERIVSTVPENLRGS